MTCLSLPVLIAYSAAAIMFNEECMVSVPFSFIKPSSTLLLVISVGDPIITVDSRCGFDPVCVNMCLFRFPDVVNDSTHCLQGCGFDPVCANSVIHCVTVTVTVRMLLYM